MSYNTSSNRYAKALISFSIDKGKLDILFEEVQVLHNILEDSKDLREFILNPTITKDYKKSLLDEISKSSLPTTLMIFDLLYTNNRIDMLLNVCSAFIKQYYQYKNIVEVTITTPVEISEDVENIVMKYVSTLKNGTIKLIKNKDISLVAGFTLDFDNTRLDVSIKKRLSLIKKQLKTTN
ncbi:MAG: ATP synthase F1 subunit delta [Candidatus Marinimicrobia bacterium]|nr:ATP synthase F1 subunit delta [Candidatus Neomarinimicrobiota bacterium]